MIQLLIDNPLLLLFLIAAISYPLGRFSFRGSSLGVAAVLFVGLAFGALDPNLKLPETFYSFGLVLFVYTIGLSSGPGFFASLRRKGLRDNLLVIGVLSSAALIVALLASLLGLKSTIASGLYTGSLTNTPALAGVIEYIRNSVPEATREQLLTEPVIGYSIAYPMGVLGMILSIVVLQKLWKVDYAAEASSLREFNATNQRLHNRTVLVTNPSLTNIPLQQLTREQGWDVVFGRMKRGGEVLLTDAELRLQLGDQLSVVGVIDEVEAVVAGLGERSTEALELDRTNYDYRRVFVSNPAIAGHRIGDLHLAQQYGALITRVRRGDIEMLAHDETVLEPGDRVRVVAPRGSMESLSDFFGDSYRALSEIDMLTFSIGLVLGLLLGMVPIPLPGGAVFRLGFAGGPLVVALILGAIGRTGPILWSLPYSANLILRQMGLILLLAGIGTRAGYGFVSTLSGGSGIQLLLAGMLITFFAAFTTLWIGYKIFHIPMSLLIGMLAGLQTQPGVLGFALDQTRNDLPNIGYATVYPVATITKIFLAQLLMILLS